MSTILGIIVNAICKTVAAWIDRMSRTELETKAEAMEKAVKTVGEARTLERSLREAANVDDPPSDPRNGQRWVDPHTGKLREWDAGKKEWGDAKTDPGDIFGDHAWNV